ncbi:sugar nucleotide-binding protein [Ectobacillus sp. sgz5001026]|uniref:sugar nucleotide-binding protein n=1 Tax=Ectobacillus sp. sgz5001026 TaxID=3242473 RepID=UPI0036D3F343
MKKLLVLGASGLVGKALLEECRDGFDVYGTYHSSVSLLPGGKQLYLDIQQGEKILEMIREMKPEIVVSCLRGEFPHQLAFHQKLAFVLQESQSMLYYFSTANVFDGDFSQHHKEADLTVAESEYGNFKIQCEHILQQILGEHVSIIRIPQIWGKESLRLNQLKEFISGNKAMEIYHNLACNNLLDTQLAKQMRYIFEQNLKGIFHLGSTDMMMHAKFAENLLRKITNQDVNLPYHLFDETEEIRYFGLESSRTDIPKELQITNEAIIQMLVG